MSEETDLDTVLTRLTEAADRLNEASSLLTKQIDIIDSSLNALNLGVGAWHDCNDGSFLSVGYVHGPKRWGLAIRRREPKNLEDFWFFNHAPRAFRIHVGPFILPLLEETLLPKANEMIIKLKKANELALQYAEGIEEGMRQVEAEESLPRPNDVH